MSRENTEPWIAQVWTAVAVSCVRSGGGLPLGGVVRHGVTPCFSLQIVFGSIVLLMLWLPIRIIKSLLPSFLPYNVMLYR